MMHFCWLPPLSAGNRGVDSGGLHAQTGNRFPGMARFAVAIDHAGARDLAQRAERNVLAHIQMRKQPKPFAIFGHQRHAGGASFGGMSKPNRLAAEHESRLAVAERCAEQAFE